MSKLQAHHIRVSTFAHATEDPEKVLEAMGIFFPEDIPSEDIEFEILETEGYFGNPIKVINAEVKKSKSVKKILKHLTELLNDEDKEYLLENLEEKVDETGTLFIRLNKQKAYLGEAEVDEGEDVIQIKIKIKAFPMKKETVMKTVQEWLSE
ncbi:RNA-binding protein [Thermococcus argininiproducens]|uniref:RNA-binding protein n=1 Tax=Thermococcus argininiproducens TaxID=2866384 RepID=A0A9E7M938_9EURY|nr:RNA-binding protein [Thermococcus argininiproducens]USG99625.1 RNA-binding protein [Thermococcus argininiproducens]